MQIGFVLPTPDEVKTIDRLRDQVDALRPDQVTYFEHLLKSWRIFHSRMGLALCARAYRKTINNRP